MASYFLMNIQNDVIHKSSFDCFKKSIDKYHKNDHSYRFANNRSIHFCACYFTRTLFTFRILTRQLLTIPKLNFEQILGLKIGERVANSVDPDETPHFVANYFQIFSDY